MPSRYFLFFCKAENSHRNVPVKVKVKVEWSKKNMSDLGFTNISGDNISVTERLLQLCYSQALGVICKLRLKGVTSGGSQRPTPMQDPRHTQYNISANQWYLDIVVGAIIGK